MAYILANLNIIKFFKCINDFPFKDLYRHILNNIRLCNLQLM